VSAWICASLRQGAGILVGALGHDEAAAEREVGPLPDALDRTPQGVGVAWVALAATEDNVRRWIEGDLDAGGGDLFVGGEGVGHRLDGDGLGLCAEEGEL
jgi:hypothetical protein